MKDKNNSRTISWTGERFIPGIDGDIELEHFHRYAIARELSSGKVVLDIACGEGYGSAILAMEAQRVVGVDIAKDVIRNASEKYSKSNLTFKVGSCTEIPLEDSSVDLVVCFETIEHHNMHREMIEEIKRVLLPDGILIISSPDKYEYSDKPNFSNPFHVKEIYRNEFINLINEYFDNAHYFGQRVLYGSGIFGEKGGQNKFVFRKIGKEIFKTKGLPDPVYNIAVASDSSIYDAFGGIFETPIWESQYVKSIEKARAETINCYKEELAERDKKVNSLAAEISEKAEWVNKLNDQLTKQDAAVGNLTTQLAKRDATVSNLTNQLTKRDARVYELTDQLNNRNATVNKTLAELNKQKSKISWRNDKIERLTLTIDELNNQIADRDKRVDELNNQIADRDKRVDELTIEIAELNVKENGLISKLAKREVTVNDLNTQLRKTYKTVKELNAQLALRDETVKTLTDQLNARDNELNIILKSNSWKITSTLRSIRRFFITFPYILLRKYTSNLARKIWYNLPLSYKIKSPFKDIMFRAFPLIFKHTLAYRTWKALNYNQIKSTSSLSNQKKFTELKEGLAPYKNTIKKEKWVPIANENPLPSVLVKLIAFYLPQFHQIPENDEWWGEGFTEWTNVQRGIPQYLGHYQPHVPGELGYYDLLKNEVQQRQVELAKLYGINGFCFYFYWFAGKRLLESPIRQYVNNKKIDLPFCLCWANENWSRRWDGLDDEILISQKHSPEDDLLFIEHLSQYLKDPRYIRVKGKPLIIVYRPGLLPSAKKTAQRWRKWCLQDKDIGEIYLAYTQSFENINPEKIGFDGAIEFPPNNFAPKVITDQIVPKRPEFTGVIYDWNTLIQKSYNSRSSDYSLFRGVCPSWDNTPRRMNNASIFWGSTPEKYGEWIENATIDTIRRFKDPSERLVFINAWNEWAEGAYLEPNQRYGYAYLQSTREALERVQTSLRCRRIILVSHDAYPHGAQYILLNIAKILSEELCFKVEMIVLGDGPLIPDFEKYSKLHLVFGKNYKEKNVKNLLKRLYSEGVRSAITNTTVAGPFVPVLKEQGFHVISLVHELPGLIRENNLLSCVDLIVEKSDCIVFPAKKVMRSFFDCCTAAPLNPNVILPQGLYKKNVIQSSSQIQKARCDLRSKYNLPKDSKIVLCVGFADKRKGFDLFVEIGLKVLKVIKNAYFIWVGQLDPNIIMKTINKVEQSEYFQHFIFNGNHTFETDIYYAGSDIYALTSREDPFPSVVLESYDARLPVIAFKGVGGITQLIARTGGRLVPKYDTDLFAAEIIEMLQSPLKCYLQGEIGKKTVKEDFSMRQYVFNLVSLTNESLRRVTVIVPNYNYAHYLEKRITSIVQQDYPIYEIIILDDFSDDNSIIYLKEILSTITIDNKLITNEKNSGNVFRQWRKGVEEAKGDFIWIAEADDLSETEFLSEVIKAFDDPTIVMSYCQSKQIDSDGQLLSDNYLDYVSDISLDKWKTRHTENGKDEILNCLAIKNSIPNVSSIVFKKNKLKKILEEKIDEISSFKIVGDWLTYTYILENGKIAFSPRSLNLHRRHSNSVTISRFNLDQLKEILLVQKKIRDRFNLSDEIITKAYEYSQSLYEQFDLTTSEALTISENSLLKSYIEYD
jgi:glycosyltransferase involved in cell wall biosynthesis/SAM-dependent methyltransferase